MKTFNAMACLALLTVAISANAADLLEVWRGVGSHDPDVAAALSAKLAGEEKKVQARSLWLPNINLGGNSSWINSNSGLVGANFSAPGLGLSNGVIFNTSVKSGVSNSWSVLVRQAVFSKERLAQTHQLMAGAKAAEYQWQYANEELMLRTAQRYFDVVLLSKKLSLLQSQHKTIEIETNKAKDKFKIGELPIIDAREAFSRQEVLSAQIMSAENELETASLVLSDTSQIAMHDLNPKEPKDQLKPFEIKSIEDLQNLARDGNPLLKMLELKLEGAHHEVAAFALAASTALDLVAQASQQRINGNGAYGASSITNQQQSLGIQLTIPLFTGGFTSSKHVEAIQLEERAKHELASAELKVRQSVQSTWLGLKSGMAKINALKSGLLASQSKLSSTRLAQEVGDRTTLDLLDATNEETLVKNNLLQAKIDYLLNQLNLFALIGQLDEQSLESINNQLEIPVSTQ